MMGSFIYVLRGWNGVERREKTPESQPEQGNGIFVRQIETPGSTWNRERCGLFSQIEVTIRKCLMTARGFGAEG
ncbi:MAG: hypothetical protein LIO46_05500, partial [Clostridiales bacterium]|nr:hypothetical protein [Clostridiales bacterium]